MDEQIIANICSGNITTAKPSLEKLLQLGEIRFTFPELDFNDLRIQLWSALFEYLRNPSASQIHLLCLSNVRIISRDKTNLDNMVCEKWVNVLIELAGLYQLTVADEEQLLSPNPPDDVKLEALKCLCNLIYNSTEVQSLCAANCLIEGIISRLKSYKDSNIPQEIKYFDIKVLFILTALRPEKRETVKNEQHGLVYLIECLDEILKEASSCEMTAASLVEGDHHYFLNNNQVDMSCEILKVLFNLVLSSNTSTCVNEQEEIYILRLVTICNNLLLSSAPSQARENELHTNVVNFLTSVPNSCYVELAPLLTDNSHKNYEFEGRNMEAVHSLINILETKLSLKQNINYLVENITPILSVLHKAASSHSFLRKYLRALILPPLKDVHTRPEEGNTLRNQLCRLLTSPMTHVRDITAQFLFILCKENVSRMVKYTGYGNAAGLFTTRGLLGPEKRYLGSSQYSSDSDSDTEEYRAMRHTVNPVTGCYEPPRTDPMAGYSDEQKEYEAMKLLNLMDQLNRVGIVQPCRIGPDGRPEPVEHILQLQEELPNQQIHRQ